MAGPFVLLHKPDGTPLLAWGSDVLVERAHVLGYQQLVLTADPHPRYNPAGLLINRNCRYQDRGIARDRAAYEFAVASVKRCAPGIAANLRAGKTTLITCAAGENRSALMTARVAWELTGTPGAEIVGRMRELAPPSAGYQGVFTNGDFRREAQSWPRKAPTLTTTTNNGIWWMALTALAVAGVYYWGTR